MKHLHVVITGATSVGRALAMEYAEDGVTLSLTGRDKQRLSAVAKECQGMGARTYTEVIDVQDGDSLRSWLYARDDDQPVDVVIANAGVSSSIQADGSGEELADIRRLFAVNTLGVIETITPMAERMRVRGKGRVVIIGSMAGWRGLSSSPAYCGSKAGAMIYGESLRAWLTPYGVRVCVVSMGHVDTPMNRRFLGGKPMRINAEGAARKIRRGVDSGKPEITFPLILGVGTKLLTLLPKSLGDWIVRQFFTFVVEPDCESPLNNK